MSDVTLQIKIDSAPAQSGAAAIRAELDSLKSKYGEVIALQGMVADAVTNASAKIIAAAERKAAAETAAAAKIEAASISAAAKVEAASVAANARQAIAAENRAARETAAVEKATAAASNQVSTYERAAASIMEGDERRQQTQRALIDTADRAAAEIMAGEMRRAEAAENAASRAAAAAAQEEAAKARAVANENELVERAAAAVMTGEMRKAEAAQKAAAEQQRAVSGLTAAYAPHLAELDRLARNEREIIALRSEGAMRDDVAAQALARLHQRQQVVTIESHRMAEGARLNASEMRNLSYQVNDVVSGLAMGQSPMMILTQQGGQFVQIFQQAGIKIGGVAAGLTAFAAAAVGATAAAISHQNSMREVAGAYAMQGGYVGLSKSQLEDFARQSAATGEISVREARALESATMRAGQVSGAALKTIADSAHHVAAALTDGDISKAGELLTKAFLDPEKAAKELDATLNFLTDSQRRQISVLSARNEKEAAFDVIMQALNPRLKEHADTIHPISKAWTEAKNAASDYWNLLGRELSGDTTGDKLAKARSRLAIMQAGGTGSRLNRESYSASDVSNQQKLVDGLEKQLQTEKAVAALEGDMAKWRQQDKVGGQIGRDMAPGLADLDALQAKKKQLEDSMAAGSNIGASAESLKNQKSAFEAVNHAIDTYVTEGKRAELIAEAHAKAATMDDMAARKFLATREAEISLMGKAVVASEREAKVKAASGEATAAEAKAYKDAHEQMAVSAITTREKVALASLDSEREAVNQRRNLLEISAADELTQLRGVDDKKRAIEMQAAQDRLVQIRKNDPQAWAAIDAGERAVTELREKHLPDRQKQLGAELAARTKAAREMSAIALEAEGSAANDNISAKTENVSFQKSMGKIDGTEELAALRAIAEEKYQIEVDLLEKKKALGGLEEVDRKRIDDQILALDRKRAADMTVIDHKAAQERLASVNAWTAPIGQAMNGMVTGFLQGTNSMRQIMGRFGQSIVLSYANMAAQAGMKWFNQHVVMSVWDKMFATQEVATAAAKEGAKTRLVAGGQASQTMATRTGATARTASGATEEAGFFSRIGTQVSAWFGFEAAKTGATTTGEATRTGVTVAGAETREVVEDAATASSIGKSAAAGAAGAYKDACENIPYGWLIGAGIAAAAFAGIMAFSSFGGEGEVPYDGALYQLHAKETVLPASLAVPLREALTTGKFGNAADNIAAPQAIMAGAGMSVPAGLSRPPSGAGQNTTNNSSQSVAPVINVQFTHNGGGSLTKEQIMQHSVTIAKAVASEIKGSNRDLRGVLRHA